ncbi:MAG TPA: cyclopropane-fatty-acyl-phospholipid synthase family protein [Stellaceae bacterium]|jgi:cyclopropane-fatty-acyl-phospholipid synthase
MSVISDLGHAGAAARERLFPLAVPLRSAIRQGSLTVIEADGTAHSFGRPGTNPQAAIRLHNRRLPFTLLQNTELRFGEAYMDGTITIEEGTLRDLVEIVALNSASGGLVPWQIGAEWFFGLRRRLQQHNPIKRARANVAHHYDLSDQLYELFLDPNRQYSCAYFRSTDDTLETAQVNKMRHLADKLMIEPGMRVLDIGSGWGGLAMYLARETGAEVTGLTLSTEQQKYASLGALKSGLADRVQFHLRDYREETGMYDRIVSVGMLEHVGVNHYPEFFAKVRNLLDIHGIALLHAIGRRDGPGATSAWLRKYIFPGGYAPALSEVLPHIEASDLWVTDIEVLRLHYARTLHEWHRRFSANRAQIAELYDERFCRMWELYLVGCEMQFRHLDMMVFQIQLAREVDAVPITRDYLYA